MHALGPDLRRRDPDRRDRPQWQAIGRLLHPLDDAHAALGWSPNPRWTPYAVADAIGLLLHACALEEAAYWGWTSETWVRLLGPNETAFIQAWRGWVRRASRQALVALAYLLCGFAEFHQLGVFSRRALAWRVFGREPVEDATTQLLAVLGGWGYRFEQAHLRRLRSVICQVLLLNRSPLLEDLSTQALLRLRDHPGLGPNSHGDLHGVHRAVAALGYADPSPPPAGSPRGPVPIDGAPGPWVQAVERWHATSTLTPKVRVNFRVLLAKIGRWLAAEHPDIQRPEQWTRQTCAAWVAAVDRMRVGDYAQTPAVLGRRRGTPLSARSKANLHVAARVFFRDLQEWDWIPRRFDPARALATPRSVLALIAPDPRVIADDVWAKLLWAGLNLELDDLPDNPGGRWYPLELVRAVTLTWLFGGLRSDEIARLGVGCVRWQRDGAPVPSDSTEVLVKDAVCLLDVPTNKTGTAFTKPVDPLLGQAIQAWQAIRPSQPPMSDRKTGERVDFLFAYRARRIATAYINLTIIPTLCRKAGVPTADVRGKITSHRGRSTIATQLYNAKEPMTLFELQQWLGHRSLDMVRHYATIHPTRLAKAYRDAGYFARNLRTIEVLIDRDAIAGGTATAGGPWQYYDLGHGWCSYSFFEQCPHRMACARCDFYLPKDSTKAQTLQAKANLQRMLAEIPLTDEERAAVDDDVAALDRLVKRLADVPTPAGATPRELDTAGRKLLPLVVPPSGKVAEEQR